MERGPLFSRINIVPLVGVLLAVAVALLATLPQPAKTIDAYVPPPMWAIYDGPLPPEPVIVDVGADGSLKLGGEPIPQDRLVEAVRAEFKARGVSEDRVQVRGDPSASYGDVVAAMNLLKAGGLKDFHLLDAVR